MGKLWCNEELAARAKAGNKEAFALLWAQNRRHIYYLAVKYRSIIEQNAFVDLVVAIIYGFEFKKNKVISVRIQ